MAKLVLPAPHLATPILPTAWHASVTSCLADLCTISALFEMRLVVDIAERHGGEMRFEVGMVHPADVESESLIARACERCREMVPFVCIKCGSQGMSVQRGKWFYCPVHVDSPVRRIHRSALAQVQSPWHVGGPVAPIERMAVQDSALKAAKSTARRYNSAPVGEMIARAQSLQAQHIMNQVWPPIHPISSPTRNDQ